MSGRNPSRPCERAPSATDDADFNWPPTDAELAQFQRVGLQSTTADSSAGDHALGPAETSAALPTPTADEETAAFLADFEDERLMAPEPAGTTFTTSPSAVTVSAEATAIASHIGSESSFVAIPDRDAAFERISDGVQASEQSRIRRGRVTAASRALVIRTLVAAVGVVVGVILAVWLHVGVRTRESVAPATRSPETPAAQGFSPADRSTSNPAPTAPIVTPPAAALEGPAPRRGDSAPSAAPVQRGPIRPPAAGQNGVTKPRETAAASAPAGGSAPSQLLPRVLIDPIPVRVPPRPEVPVRDQDSPTPAPEGPPALEPAVKPTVPAAGVPDDRSAIQEVLQRYERAYAALDARAAAAVWPSVDERALQKAFALLQSQDLVFHRCDVTTAGFHATAQCSGELRYVPRVGSATIRTQPHAWTFQLDRVGDEWQVTSVNGR